MKRSDPYIPLDYELLVRGKGEEELRVVHDTYSFGMTVPQYNLELFQSGEPRYSGTWICRPQSSVM